MKRKVILAIVAIALLISGVAGGIAYSQMDHQPPRGQKLIGMGWCGLSEASGDEALALSYYWNTDLRITNPNDVRTLTIAYFAIMDEEGNVVVEGTPEQLNEGASEETYVPEELGPHEIWGFHLSSFIGGPPGVIGETPPSYTVEITWTGQASRPLIGWVQPFALMLTFLGGFDLNIPWEEQVDDVDLTTLGWEMANFPK